MKKIVLFSIILIFCVVLFISGQSDNKYVNSNITKAEDEKINQINCIELYEAYLNGKHSLNIDGTDYTINELAYEYAAELDELKYAFYDMNDDKTPELHIRSPRFYIILTCREEELLFWCEESVYSTPLNNKAMLYIYSGGAPYHIIYEYRVFDFSGNIIEQVSFEKYDDNEDGFWGEEDLYIFSEKKVPQKTWDELTEEYLTIGSDNIQWIDYATANEV